MYHQSIWFSCCLMQTKHIIWARFNPNASVDRIGYLDLYTQVYIYQINQCGAVRYFNSCHWIEMKFSWKLFQVSKYLKRRQSRASLLGSLWCLNSLTKLPPRYCSNALEDQIWASGFIKVPNIRWWGCLEFLMLN